MSLVIQSVAKSFGGHKVLEDISLTVATNEVFGLIGPNGAGKSTLFALITGHQAPTSGDILFEGQSLGSLSVAARAKRGLIRTFQVPREFTHLTVRENLLAAYPDQSGEVLLNVFLRPGQVARDERAATEEANRILHFLKLEKVADESAGRLSGGQKKLLELGRTLMARPKMILLDEPFAGVNPVLIDEIIDHLHVLAGQGIGLLIIEHDLEALSRLVPKMAVLDQGRIIATGTPSQVLSNAAVREAYLGGAVA